MAENFWIDLIASLKKGDSKKQVKEDIKNLGDIKIPLIGTLNKSKTKAQIKQDLSSLNGTVDLTGKVNNKRVAASMKEATAQAQKQVDSKPVEMAFSVKKEKLVNDIKLLAQQNSRLFKDTDMSIKYNSLLDNAEMARNSVQLSTLRTQLGSLRSELKITGNSGLAMTDALKNGLTKVLQLFGSSGIIMQFRAQLRNAWTEAKELDKAMTDLSRVNEAITRDGFPEYLDRVISKTKQLAVSVKDYIDSMTTFSRAGYNYVDSEALADAAIQLEKVGDMSAEAASKSLLSGLQAYEKIDGYGMDQLAEKAQALNDKIDLLGNTASISQKDLAEGIQAVGSVMSDANTSVDEFLSMLAAGNRSVQDSNKVALAIRTSALRIRGCTVELQEMGETTDDVIESTSTLAEKIKGLTNINGSGGVNILEADEETFRSIYDIYNDIAKVYDKMSDKDASALLDLIAGKNRSNQISAILQNMSEANVLLEQSLNAAGTASAEYEIYLNSAEAASERFGVAMTEAYSNLISGETVKGLTNAGTAVLDFANSWNILEGTLRGFLALGVLKGVTTLTVAFKNSALQISNYGSALSAVKDLNTYAQSTEKYADAMNTLKTSCVNLTDAQLKQVLANRKLEKSQLIEILQLKDLEEEQRDARLAQLGLIKTTETQTTAQGAATASTFSLSAAIKGLGVSIKTAIMTNPVGIAIMAISTAIGVATSLISKYNQQLEETRQKNIEAATTASENADKLRSLYTEYNRLASIQDRTTSEEESFKTAVENITVALGNKAKALENLTAGTDEYSNALAKATKEELQSSAVQATIGRKSAEETFRGDIWSDWKGSKVSVDSNNKGKSLSAEAQKAVAIVSDSLKEFETINRTWNNISWDISSSDPEEALAFYNALVEAREKLVLASENDESLLDTEIYSDMNNAINAISENLDTYIEKRYQEEKLNYLAQNSIPDTTEEYKAMEAALTDTAGSSADLQEKFKELLTADFTSLATGIEEIGDAFGNIPYTAESFSFPAYEEQINDIKSSLSTLRSALDAFNTGTLDESTVLDLMQEFPELTPYIDLAADGFGNLSEGLSVLLAQQPVSLIQSLQELKDSLNTDAEREQVDLLINSLQSLSSYGDSGIEAYATTIGSTWNDTANVIEGVTTQFENLAKVQEAVADGLTMSMDAAAELAAMYPEILTNAEYAGNGQITLNEEVVKSILAGDKSIVDAQITKLEADKATLEAKKSYAEAQLEMIRQVAEGEGNITKEVAQYRLDIANALLQALIEAGMEEDRAYAAVAANMAGNMDEYNRIVGEVAKDTSVNMDRAAVSMANSININAINAQKSFESMQKKVWDLADSIKAAANGDRAGNSGIYGGGGSTSGKGIVTDIHSGDFGTTLTEYTPKSIDFDEFESQLQIDISAYQKAISNIDAQIEILKNLQATFDKTSSSANGGIGGHDYRDKIKDLEKEKDKINSVLDDAKSGSSTKEKKDEYKELFDFFERRIKNLNAALSLLKTNLDNVTGSFAKNKLIDAEIGISEEKFKNYSDALNMYTQKANEALSKLPTDIAEKIKDGAVDLTTFIGDGNKDVVEAIKDYEQWADKVADCKQELAELKTAIRQLELEKFNNIVEEFTNQFDLREDGKDLVSKQMALLKEAGELIGESFFNTQIDQSKKQLELLEAEKARLVEQMESALASGRVDRCPLPQ